MDLQAPGVVQVHIKIPKYKGIQSLKSLLSILEVWEVV